MDETGPSIIAGTDPLTILAGGYLTFTEPRRAFDGFDFSGDAFHQMIHWLYLAAKARRGDGLAAELLNAGQVTITAADGRSYWPMKSAEEELRGAP